MKLFRRNYVAIGETTGKCIDCGVNYAEISFITIVILVSVHQSVYLMHKNLPIFHLFCGINIL